MLKCSVVVVGLALVLGACRATIHDRTDDDGDDDDGTSDDDAGSPTDFTLTCTANVPGVTTSRVRIVSNFATDQQWLSGPWSSGRAVTWVGDLDEARLTKDPCPYNCTSCGVCGYVFNVEHDPSPPQWLLRGNSAGGADAEVTCNVDGPGSVNLVVNSTSSTNNGRNYHLDGG